MPSVTSAFTIYKFQDRFYKQTNKQINTFFYLLLYARYLQMLSVLQ